MDGWRGSRLGYAGGRTGYMANYGNNDALRGTLGQTTWSAQAFRNSARNQQVAGNVVAIGALAAGAFFFGPSVMSVAKDLRKKAAKVAVRVQKGVQKANPLN